MKIPELPSNEQARLDALHLYHILDTSPEDNFDYFTQLAQQLIQTPIALISLVDKDRQWFKSKIGIEANETPRDTSFCGHAILQDALFEVCDALHDPRFFDNPLVVNTPNIRFYAGAPLITSSGFKLGTLCVIDTKPRELNQQERESLVKLAHLITIQIEQRAANEKIKLLNEQILEHYNFTNSILNAVPAGIAYFNQEIRCKFANQRYLDWIRASSEMVIGQKLQTFLDKNYFNKVHPYIINALQGDAQTFQTEWCNPQGEVVYLNVSYMPHKNHKGEVLGYFSHITNISTLIKAQEAEKIALMCIEQANEGVMVTDKNANIVSVNAFFTQITGYTEDEVIGKNPRILKSGRHEKEFYHQIWNNLQQQGHWQGEIWDKRKNGEIFQAAMMIDSLKNERGELTHFVSTLKDNTENYQIRHTLESVSTMMERAGELAKVAVWELDLSTNQVIQSKQNDQLFEVESGTLISIEDSMQFYPKEAQAIKLASISACAQHGTPWDLELPITTAKGRHLKVRSQGQAVYEQGKIVKISCVLHDITDRKAQEDARIAHELNLSNTLVREVHHRIKNNLQGVTGILHNFITRNPDLSEPLTTAISQLQSVAVIHGLQSTEFETDIDFKSLAEAICSANASLWLTDIQLKTPENWKACYLTPSESVPVALILNELVTNAIKHSENKNMLDIQLSQDKELFRNNIRIASPGKFKENNNLSKSNNGGLALITSLMPRKGASLLWDNDETDTVVNLTLHAPVVHY